MAFSFVDELELKDYAMFLSKVFFLVALIFSWIRNNYILFIYWNTAAYCLVMFFPFFQLRRRAMQLSYD